MVNIMADLRLFEIVKFFDCTFNMILKPPRFIFHTFMNDKQIQKVWLSNVISDKNQELWDHPFKKQFSLNGIFYYKVLFFV